MPESDSDLRAAIEARAKKARPYGQVEDRRPPVRKQDGGAHDGRGRRFVIVEEPPPPP